MSEREPRFWTWRQDEERLMLESPEEAIGEAIDFHAEKHTPITETIRRYTPLAIYGYATMVAQTPDADYAVDHFMETLADEYGDPDGDTNDILTDEACATLKAAIEAAYEEAMKGVRIWSCEVIETKTYSTQDVEKVLREDEPEWFKDETEVRP